MVEQNPTEIAMQFLTGTTQPTASELEWLLQLASDQYNNDGESFLADSEYDALEIMLRKIHSDSGFLKTVGSDVRGGKVKLPVPMAGLDQLYEGDTEKWIADNNLSNSTFVVTEKLDGTSGLLVYENGQLQIAYSRGNGLEGADITRHVKRMKNIPLKIEDRSSIKIRVEFVLADEDFKNIQKAAMSSGNRVYKNARNYTAGKMNCKQAESNFYDAVHAVATSLIEPELNKNAQQRTLTMYGFEQPRTTEILKGRDLTETYLTTLLQTWRKSATYDIDGIVIDVNVVADRATLTRGGSSLNPTYAKKYKIGSAENIATSRVVAVHWRPSKTGYLKPRVEIEPVELMGVTITYCTAFNAAYIRNNGVGPGAELQVTRSGDVIPFIVVVTKPVEPAMPDTEEFGEMYWTENSVDLFVADSVNNELVQFYRTLDTFNQLDVVALKDGNMKKLFDAGYDNAVKIIKATEIELKTIVGESAGSKIYSGIRTKLTGVELAKLASASQTIGRGIGSRKLRKLVNSHGNLQNLTFSDIVAVEGFSDKTANRVLENLPEFQKFLDDIDGYYTLAAPKQPIVGGLTGVSVCFTGVRSKEIETAIENAGGTIANSVNKNTTYLVAKNPDENSSKLAKARSLGVKIISLTQAQQLWN